MATPEELQAELERIKAENAALRQQMAQTQDGAVAQGNENKVVGKDGILVGGNVGGSVIVVKEGGQVVTGEQPIAMTADKRNTALGRYIEHVIAHNRYLQLQGIRSGGKLVNIELENIYITLRTTRSRTFQAEDEMLAAEMALAPGEMQRFHKEQASLETVNVRVEEALAEHRHLVVLGDPGSGKTTLLRYLALLYARDLAERARKHVAGKLKLSDQWHLPILLPLRQIGAYLRTHRPKDDGLDGCGLLLEFLLEHLRNQRVDLPEDFFDQPLQKGQAVILLDGMDEVADPELRARVARLVESFTLAYPQCRFVVTSRIVGYSGPTRLGSDYVTTTVRDFTLSDVEQFLKHWHRLVAIGQMGVGPSADTYAANQTAQLLETIRNNERIRELAINPLMLTVIALVHRDRVKLPDRRAELYAEAVDVLLGKWDDARQVREIAILDDQPFDAGDKRLLLQSVALWMHERQQKEIAAEDLRGLLTRQFAHILTEPQAARRAVERFLTVIEERTGLLVARGEGVYAFSHLTFQEYLTALAIAGRDDYVKFTLSKMGEAWWREVILLEAGYLSIQSKERTTLLIKSIAEHPQEPELFYNRVLAAECIRDVGSNRVLGDLNSQVWRSLKAEIERPIPETYNTKNAGWLERITGSAEKRVTVSKAQRRQVLERREAAIRSLGKIGAQQYWSLPYGEPEWITIPAGEFFMGSELEALMGIDAPLGVIEIRNHKLFLPEFQIARVPVTNEQYALFIKASGHHTPDRWEDNRPPKGKEAHPVVHVTWDDAIAYCQWLSQATGKAIALSSEAEWEKSARGSSDQRAYPWGETFDVTKCNTSELGLGDTAPVGIFLEGASPYGVLDLSGNVWEWTRSLWGKDFEKPAFKYPYNPKEGREDVQADENILRVLRGGSFYDEAWRARCDSRHRGSPVIRNAYAGFRVVVLPCR